MRKEIWIILICTIILVVFLSYTLYVMGKHFEELSTNPLTYSVRKLSEKNGDVPTFCSCNVGDYHFMVTEEGIITDERRYDNT